MSNADPAPGIHPKLAARRRRIRSIRSWVAAGSAAVMIGAFGAVGMSAGTGNSAATTTVAATASSTAASSNSSNTAAAATAPVTTQQS